MDLGSPRLSRSSLAGPMDGRPTPNRLGRQAFLSRLLFVRCDRLLPRVGALATTREREVLFFVPDRVPRDEARTHIRPLGSSANSYPSQVGGCGMCSSLALCAGEAPAGPNAVHVRRHLTSLPLRACGPAPARRAARPPQPRRRPSAKLVPGWYPHRPPSRAALRTENGRRRVPCERNLLQAICRRSIRSTD